MIHVRELIRKQIISQLMGLPTTGAHVYDTQVYSFDVTQLPALVVMAQSETIEASNLTAPRDVDRQTEFVLMAYVRAGEGYQDILDRISAEVEPALSTDLTLNGLTKDITLDDVTFEYDAGDQPIGKMSMTYSVFYRTKENNTEVST